MKSRTLLVIASLIVGVALATNPVVVQAAGKITGRDIKDGTVTSRDVKDRSLRATDFKPGQIPQGRPGPQGPRGETGPAGPQGPSGVVDSAFASGEGVNPTASWSFLAPTAVVTLPSGGEAFIVSNMAFGSRATDGARDLNLAVCHQRASPSGPEAVRLIGTFAAGHRVAQDTRTTLTMSAVLSGEPAGDYKVGLCGYSNDFANWNWNDYGHTSALVYRSSGGGGAAPTRMPSN